MADLKKKLGKPPDKTEVKNNLQRPGPAEIAETYEVGKLTRPPVKPTVQFNTSISPELKADIAEIAYKLPASYNQILIEAIAIYKKLLIKDGKI
jgi:hypothetical protein